MNGVETGRAASSGDPVASIRLYLLGRFEVVRGDVPIPPQAWRRRRPADLLKLVALTPGRVLSREAVIETLWPGKDPASGANNLHRALYDLRQILGARWVDLDHGKVSLEPSVWVDVGAFEAAAARGDPAALESAVALYRGDLAPEDLESPWLARRRAELRLRLSEVALPTAEAAAARGEAALAVSLLRRVLDVDPTREEPNALLMRLLAESGRRADALRQYEVCEVARSARGLGAPAEALRALYDAILRGQIGSSLARLPYDGYRRAALRLLGQPEPAPLRGRTGSVMLFESLAEQGSGSLVLLGERGVGMTRLAVEGARIAQAKGAVVLTGVCDPSRPAPYSPFADLFSDYSRAGGNGSNPFDDRMHEGCGALEGRPGRLHEAVREQLAAIGSGRPVYLLIDDLHDADESSANLFHDLARAARALRLMLVATCREDAVRFGTPVQMLLAHLDCERLARGVRVQRLDLPSSRAQLSDLLGTPPGEPLAAQFYRMTDGSPFYTEELARAFKESGQVRLALDPASALRERVARLGPAAEALLEAAAVAGHRFDFEVVRPASGLGGSEALAALDQALEVRILDEDGSGYHFHHALVRDAIYGALPAARRVSLHRAVADAIDERASGAPGGMEDAAEALAYHRRAADQPDRAFGHLVAAGHRAAARGGLSEANAFYEGAVALADAAEASGPRRLELLEALAEVQLAQAELPEAVRAFEAAASLRDLSGWRPGPAERARARRGAALALLVGGRTGEAKLELEAGLSDALAGSGDERAETLLLLSEVAWHEGRERESRELAERCAEEARGVGDLGLAGRGQEMAALARIALGEPPLDETEPTEPGPERPFAVHLVLWENDLLGDRPQGEILAGVTSFRDWAASHQARAALALSRAFEGALAARAGRLDRAEQALREALQLFRAESSALGEAFTLDRLADLFTLRGRHEEAMALLGEGVVAAERAPLRRHVLTRLHATLACNRLAAGAIYAAEDAAREASALIARHGECTVCHTLFRSALLRVAVARGRLDEAAAEAGELETMATRRGGRGLAAAARLARAHLLAALGEPGESAAAYSEAARGFDGLGAYLDGALAWAGAARELRFRGEASGAAEAEAAERRSGEVLERAGLSRGP